MHKNYVSLPAWLRPALQGTTLLGALMIGLLWAGVVFHLNAEHDEAEQEAIENSAKLARAFAENVTRTVKEVDTALLFLRAAYEKDPKNFNIADWIGGSNYSSELTVQIGIAGPDGLVKASNMGPVALGIDTSDREHFRFQAGGRDDVLFISKPMIGRTTGKLSIQLARRIRGADNSFGGIIVASLDPAYFARFYQSIDVGQNGAVGLIGLDGIFRAGAGYKTDKIGQSMLGAKPFELLQHSQAGHFYGTGNVDGLNRLVSFQRVEGFPLVVTVSLAQDEFFANYRSGRWFYYDAAAVLTLFILIVMALSIAHAVRLGRARAEIDTRTRNFQSALENMPQGLAMFDAKKRLIMCNAQYGRMYNHSPEDLKPGMTLGQILEKRIAKNLYHEIGTLKYLREQYAQSPQNTSETRELSNGRTIAVTVAPMAGGGWVTTHEDVTEKMRSEASFRLLFKSNPIPMWVFDTASLRFLAVNEAAVARYGYSRDQFLAMTVLDIRPVEEREKLLNFIQDTGGVHDGEQIWRHQASNGAKIDVAIYSRGLSYEGHAAVLVAAIDVTDRLRAEGEVRQTKAFFSAIIENVPLPITVKSAQQFCFVFVNRALETMVKLPREQIVGKTIRDVVSKETADDIMASDLAVLQSGRPTLTERRRTGRHDGKEHILMTRRIAVPGDDGAPQYLLSVIEDVTERQRSVERIAHMARHDALTDLGNRMLLTNHIDKAAARCRRHNEHFAVHILDLDHFKQVNDSLGHPVGDALLKAIAQRLLACIRETDTVARLGGDEFAILQAIEDDPRESAVVLASRLLEAVIAPCDLDGQKVIVGASIGIALAPDHGDTADLLMKRADLALYKVKADGRNGFQFFEPDLEVSANARRTLEMDLREAISREEFEVYYQPVVQISSREAAGVEALVRWRHPQRGMVSPADFISLAEETGLIVPLGEWILRKVCADAAGWPADIKAAVNLSPAQFNKCNLFEVVASALADSGLAPERLELEITETVLLQQNDTYLAVLHQLRDLGIAIVLDDFGTGYSSLSYLRMFPFDKIKIDKSFVDDMQTRADSAAIVCAVIGMAKGLDVITTAEGVETEEQFGLLRAAGCTQAQGYLFGPAVPASGLGFTQAASRREEAKVA